MKKSRAKIVLFMLAMGAMVTATTIDSQAAETDHAETETIMDAETAEETETAEDTETVEDETVQKKNGWVKEKDGCRYYVDGNYVYSRTMKIDGEWYPLDFGLMEMS